MRHTFFTGFGKTVSLHILNWREGGESWLNRGAHWNNKRLTSISGQIAGAADRQCETMLVNSAQAALQIEAVKNQHFRGQLFGAIQTDHSPLKGTVRNSPQHRENSYWGPSHFCLTKKCLWDSLSTFLKPWIPIQRILNQPWDLAGRFHPAGADTRAGCH